VQLFAQRKSNKCYILPSVCFSLWYLTCNAHAPIILSSMACPTLQYFSTLSHKRYDFREKNILNMKCEILFSLQMSKKFLI